MKNKVFSLLLLLFFLGLIPVLIYFGKKAAIFQPRAAGSGVMQLSGPSSVDVSTASFDVTVIANTGSLTTQSRGFDVSVTFPINRLQLLDIIPAVPLVTPTPGESSMLKTFTPINTSMDFDEAAVIAKANAGQGLEFSAIPVVKSTAAAYPIPTVGAGTPTPAFLPVNPTPANNYVAGSLQLATLRFKPLAAGTAPINFSFTVDGRNDSNIASFTLDGNGLSTDLLGSVTNLNLTITGPTPTPTPTLPPVSNSFFDSFDPSTETWTHSAAVGTDDWVLSTTWFHSSSHSYFSSEPATPKDDRLVTRPIAITTGATLTFWHTYAFEAGADGAVIEISINGGAWTDLGSYITSGTAYTGTINNSSTSPLGAGRALWTGGTIGTMTQVSVNLSSFAGQTAQIRFRNTADDGQGGSGWYIDDVTVTGVSVTATPTTPQGSVSCPANCPNGDFGNLDCAGTIGPFDLMIMANQWNVIPVPTKTPTQCSADISGLGGTPDQKIDAFDLYIMSNNWGQ